MDEQEVEQQLAIWREEMRQERERRLAASATSPSRTPRRAVPEQPNTECSESPRRSRLALYKSELDETTAKVTSVKLSRYSRPHVDPRDVEFFEARSVLRDYIRRPAATTKAVKDTETNVEASQARTASRGPRRLAPPPSAAIVLNRSAVLRKEAAKQAIRAYDQAHADEPRPEKKHSRDAVVPAPRTRSRDRDVSPVWRSAAREAPLTTSTVALTTAESRWRRATSPDPPSAETKAWRTTPPRQGLSVRPADAVSARRHSWELPQHQERDVLPTPQLHRPTYRPSSTSPVRVNDSTTTSSGLFTSGLQLRYGHSTTAPASRSFIAKTSRALPSPVRARETSPLRWSRFTADDRAFEKPAAPPVHTEDVSRNSTFTPRVSHAPLSSMTTLNRDDLFQGHVPAR